MTRTLAFLSALTAFALAAQAVRDHAELIGTGYEISQLERAREVAVTSEARARERVGRLASPAVLAERAKDLGLETNYPEEFAVVRIDPDRREVPDAVMVKARGR
jgi:hypothetical protein